MEKIALITGASDGIGRATAKRLHKDGYRIFGVSRTKAYCDCIEHIAADVSCSGALKNAIDDVFARVGHIDVLILSAGISLASPAALTSAADAHHVFDVNVWGCIDAVRFVLPHMQARQEGRIVLLSSMAGLLPLPYLSYYSSTKAALLAFACAAANEVRPSHVFISAVMPGGVRTGLTFKRKKYACPGACQKAISVLSREEQTGLSPDRVAQSICRILKRKRPPVLVSVGGIYKLYCFFARIFPSRFMLYILRKKYAI